MRGNVEKIKLIIFQVTSQLLRVEQDEFVVVGVILQSRGSGKPFIVSNWCRFCFLFMKTFLVYVTFIQLHFCLDPPRFVLRPGGLKSVPE